MANSRVVIHRCRVGVTTSPKERVPARHSKLEPTGGGANGGEVIRMAGR